MHAILLLSNQQGWSRDPPLPQPDVRAGSGGRGISLVIVVYLRFSKGKQILSLVSMSAVLSITSLVAA